MDTAQFFTLVGLLVAGFALIIGLYAKINAVANRARDEMRTEVSGVRVDLGGRIATLSDELGGRITTLSDEVSKLREEMHVGLTKVDGRIDALIVAVDGDMRVQELRIDHLDLDEPDRGRLRPRSRPRI